MRVKWLGLLLCVGWVWTTMAAGPGDSVVILYNSAVPDSREVAEYYAKARNVPDSQVIGLRTTRDEAISRKDFRQELQVPLAKELEQRGLFTFSPVPPEEDPLGKKRTGLERLSGATIRYLVVCAGIPLYVQPDNLLVEEGQLDLPEPLRRNQAAVDAEFAVLPLLRMNLLLAGPLRNPHYGATNAFDICPTNGVLITTRLDGPTTAIAKGLVDKALQAERDGLNGRTYFDLLGTSDPSKKTADQWFGLAAETCRRAGFEVTVERSGALFSEGFPMSQIAIYGGWYSENVAGALAKPNVEFMPGAVAYHLHSFSAATLRNPKVNWVAPFLADGVTATMGTVTEPYLGGTPNMGAFVGRFLFLGFNFGEAAYAGQEWLSWMTTVVGDPLYAPFARQPEVIYRDLLLRKSPQLDWALLRLVNLNIAAGQSLPDAVRFIKAESFSATSPVLQEKLGDLSLLMDDKPAAAGYFQTALDLHPESREQRIRLFIRLGGVLAKDSKPDQASRIYTQFLKEYPEYVDKAAIREEIRKMSN